MQNKADKTVTVILILLSLLIILVLGRITYILFNSSNKEKIPEIVSLRNEISRINLPKERKELPYLKTIGNNNIDILKIVKEYKNYPEELTLFLSANPAQLNFIKDYKTNFGKTFEDGFSSNIKENEIPLFIQWDNKWAYAELGDGTIALNGCGPTSLSMVYTGLTGDTSHTPLVFADFVNKNDFYVNEVGCKWSLMYDGAEAFNLKATALPLNKDTILNELHNGHPIICSMGKGDFTFGGHFIVLAATTQDGKIKVNDPNSPWRSLILWDYEQIENQINGLWSYSL